MLETQSNSSLQAKLDLGQYDVNDLVELHVPLHLPYIADSKDFENYSGEATINGAHYRYVKRKLVNNELILLCIRDKKTDRLQKAGTEFFKQITDTPGSEKKSKSPIKLIKGLANEFTFSKPDPISKCFIDARNKYPVLVQLFTSICPSPLVQPPNS
jgi:hypothetical protein